jgi:hypothetical protein
VLEPGLKPFTIVEKKLLKPYAVWLLQKIKACSSGVRCVSEQMCVIGQLTKTQTRKSYVLNFSPNQTE